MNSYSAAAMMAEAEAKAKLAEIEARSKKANSLAALQGEWKSLSILIRSLNSQSNAAIAGGSYFTLAKARIDRRKKEQATKDQDDQIKFVELETAAIEIKIIDFIVSGEEITFSMLNTKLMVSELKQIEIARILFHWITAQVRFQNDTRFWLAQISISWTGMIIFWKPIAFWWGMPRW